MVRDRIPLVPELEVERARDGREEVEVDERADDQVEDLLHHVSGDDSGERRASNDSDEHEQHHERAHVRRDVVVERDTHRVGRQDRHERHAARVRVAQDAVPAKRSQRRLHTLEQAAEDDVPDRDLGDGVPELFEPADDVDSRELQHADDDQRPADPSGDAQDAPPRVLRGDGAGVRTASDMPRGA